MCPLGVRALSRNEVSIRMDSGTLKSADSAAYLAARFGAWPHGISAEQPEDH